MTLVNIEKEKYNQLEEKYNLEINEKNNYINELTKNSHSLSQMTNIGNSNDATNMEALKNDYNDVTNIFIKYKILVNKLLNDKDFFFEDILIDKTLGDLRKKYPEIFGLLSEKESLENLKIYYDKQMEILRNENISLKEKNMNLSLELNELKEKLDESNKTIDDKISIVESQTSIIKNKEAFISGLENTIKESDIKLKNRNKEIQDFKQKEQDYINEKDKNKEEINGLYEVIEGIFSKQRIMFESGFVKLNKESQDKLKQWAVKFKWN